MNTRFKVFASYNILQYLCDFIRVLIFATVSKCRKSPKLTNIVMTVSMCTIPLHSKFYKIVLWYECTRIIWMGYLLQIILHWLPPRALSSTHMDANSFKDKS